MNTLETKLKAKRLALDARVLPLEVPYLSPGIAPVVPLAPNRYFRTRATVEDATAALKASEQRQPHKAAVPMAKRTNRPPPQRSSRATAVANQRFRPRTTPSKVFRAPGQAAPHSIGMGRGTKRPRPSSSSGAAAGSGGAGSSSNSGGGSLASLLGPARKHKTTVRHCLQGMAHPNPAV